MIEITHNFDPSQFMWLWSKYVTGFNDAYHCTNSIRGSYSKKLSKGNPELPRTPTLVMDEQRVGTYRALYICGVSKHGYSSHKNYPHNVHMAVLPEPGSEDSWEFENWKMSLKGGRFLPIPQAVEDLPKKYRLLPDEYTTCRIFRWAASHF